MSQKEVYIGVFALIPSLVSGISRSMLLLKIDGRPGEGGKINSNNSIKA